MPCCFELLASAAALAPCCLTLPAPCPVPPAPQHLINHADLNGDGSISWEEFLAATLDMRGTQEQLREAFDAFDADGNGVLTVQEVQQVGPAVRVPKGMPVPLPADASAVECMWTLLQALCVDRCARRCIRQAQLEGHQDP